MKKPSLSTERSDVFITAAEHCAWWTAQGWTLDELQVALGRPDPFRSWHDALIAVAQEQAMMMLQRPELRRARVVIEQIPPFRKRA